MKYGLRSNYFTTDNLEDCTAYIVDMKMNRQGDLVKALTREGSILKPTECNAVMNGKTKVILDYAAAGEGYKDDLFEMRIEIRGVFEDENDRFDEDRHEIIVHLIPSKPLKEAAKKAAVEYVKTTGSKPIIESVYDWGSDTVNEQLTAGGIVEIKGEQLKIYEETAGQGVFFINTNTGLETPLGRLPRTNEPSTLTMKIPALQAGNYRIEIRNTTRNGKTIRKGISDTVFIVN